MLCADYKRDCTVKCHILIRKDLLFHGIEVEDMNEFTARQYERERN
jgi:hypothetical protein